MVIQREYWAAAVLGFIVVVSASVLYSITKKKMDSLLEEIESLGLRKF